MTLVKESYAEREAREQAERDAFNASLPKIAKDLAAELFCAGSNDWAVSVKKTDDSRFSTDTLVVKASDGRAFDVHAEYQNLDRFTVSGTYPRDARGEMHFPYNVSRPSITVAASRGGTVLGREIKKRFLPEYDAIFATMSDTNRRNDEFHARRLAVAQEMGIAVGKSVTDGAREISFYDFGKNKLSGSLSPHEDSVTLTVSLKPELAKQVLKLISGK
jgi:hypothetical protein